MGKRPAYEDRKKTKAALDNLARWHEVDSWRDTLDEFIFAELSEDGESSKPTRRAVAALLLTMFEHAKTDVDWNMYKTPLGARKKSGMLNPYEDQDSYARAYAVAMDYVAGFTKRKDAKTAIREIAPIGDRRAGAFLDENRPEIEEKLKGATHLNGRPIKKEI